MNTSLRPSLRITLHEGDPAILVIEHDLVDPFAADHSDYILIAESTSFGSSENGFDILLAMAARPAQYPYFPSPLPF